jgi:hypothetical protein
MKLALQAHYLGRELVAFKRGADLVGDAFDQSNVMIFERGLFAPDKTEQSECVAADPDR